MKSTSAPGPDGVPALLYYRFAAALAKPLLMIWRASLNEEVMPEKWGKIYLKFIKTLQGNTLQQRNNCLEQQQHQHIKSILLLQLHPSSHTCIWASISERGMSVWERRSVSTYCFRDRLPLIHKLVAFKRQKLSFVRTQALAWLVEIFLFSLSLSDILL